MNEVICIVAADIITSVGAAVAQMPAYNDIYTPVWFERDNVR